MKRYGLSVLVALALFAPAADAVVFINEVYRNPPGSLDDTREFIELMGTPGMKLDGYAVAHLSGSQQRFFPLGSIPPIPDPIPEIDEFFSLDGLSLGANGILVIGTGNASHYPSLALADAGFQQWTTLWNGGLDTVGNLENDGSNTLILIRNRPGTTQADPTNPAGLHWGKDIPIDYELVTPVTDPQDGMMKDQFGDGSIDRGEADNLGGMQQNLKGIPIGGGGTIDDDLEIVDEMSYEHDRGWEYDTDDRRVDCMMVGMDCEDASAGLPYRRVHALDDPQGFNPDAVSRVDYRTKGAGWTPVAGAVGEMLNGNNWQDTATEQWIRGEALTGTGGAGGSPQFFYDNAANANPDAIQPFVTNVPLWLDDAIGADYNFGAANTYQIMAGCVNPLAIAFIPGDSDRDGDCDNDDISKIAAVFGDDDWVFSNSSDDAPETDFGDPATQTRPWDVDATGDNGIEASDLQWTLNFQGNSDGQIVGVRYANGVAAATGVVINSNAGTACTVTTSVNIPSGKTLATLEVGDTVEITVSGQVTGGANMTAGQQNGIMQYVHDVAIDTAGVLEVTGVTALGSFATTRSALQMLEGTSGDLGVSRVNGHTTSFTQGLGSAAPMYLVTLEAVGEGSADITIAASAEAKFAASTPRGLKIGHTNNNGNPASAGYPAALSATVTAALTADLDGDGDVDVTDFGLFGQCFGGAFNPPAVTCPAGVNADIDGDGDVDVTDFALFAQQFTGPM